MALLSYVEKCPAAKSMKKLLQIANILVLLITIAANYLLNALQPWGYSVGDISAKYQNLFTPASYAFAIWGVIYLSLLSFVVYQSLSLFGKRTDDSIVQRIGWSFVVANLGNVAWLLIWLSDSVGLSLVLMLVIFVALLKIFINDKIALPDASTRHIAFVWWPFSLYFGWITVALVANIAAYLTSIGWQAVAFGETAFTIFVLLVVATIYLFMVWKRNTRLYGLVGVWALVAIAVRHFNEVQQIAWVALALAIIIFITTSIHAHRNRKTHPFRKLTSKS